MEALLQDWNAEFGPEIQPPEWVFNLSAEDKLPENVGSKVTECEERVKKLKGELDQHLFLLLWLRRLRDNGLADASTSSKHSHVQEADTVVTVLTENETNKEVAQSESSAPGKVSSSSTESPNTASGSFSPATKSVVSPSNSDHQIFGQSSSPEASLDSISVSPKCSRHRFVHSVSSKDIQVAKVVHQRVVDEGRHWSCMNLAQASEESSLVDKRGRCSSAPNLSVGGLTRTRLSEKSKKRILSSPCPNLPAVAGENANAVVNGEHIKQPNCKTTDSTNKVIFRTKSLRKKSSTMDIEEDVSKWKGSGSDSTAIGVKRSSNGILDTYEGYNYIMNEDEDPALINVMATRIRGRLSRSSVSDSHSESEKVANGDSGGGIVSPTEDSRHTPLPSVESAAATSDTDILPALRKKSDIAPVKRVSYHYSDDECLTPKIIGESMTFAGNSPVDSEGCSHRNSGGSNGVLDEEGGPCDLTLTREKHDVTTRLNRAQTITAENAQDFSYENQRPSGSSVISEKSSRMQVLPEGSVPSDDSAVDIFEQSSDSFSELGGLGLDIESTLSIIRDRPEMSMATLLDVQENDKMNERIQFQPALDSTSEDLEYGENIEIDEATISAVTLSNNLIGSRSNSASSLPGLFSENSGAYSSPPEQESPTHSAVHGVNLRQGGGKRANRRGRMGNADLEKMTVGIGSDEEQSTSRSSTSLNSEEESVPTSPLAEMMADENMSPGSRSSRLFQVRHSTVVVHGEQLVIRKLVVVGVVSAEKSYIECLSVLKEYYRKPLIARTSTSQHIISEKDINTIFCHVDDLHQLHKTLHEQLEPVLANWSVTACVGDFFVRLCRNLHLYKDYVETFKKAVECLNKNKNENPSFKSFLEDVHLTVTKTNKDIPKVSELLRRPIDRLQSYSLVLHDLSQHTPKDHADYRILRDSLQTMSAFITSTHDPQAFRELSGGYNREMVKEGLVVELSEGFRKVRRLFLFHDVLVSAKQKPTRTSMKFEPKWYLPLNEVQFKCPEDVHKRPVPVTSEMELSVMKNKIAELKAQVNHHSRNRERSSSTSGDGFNIRRNIFMIKYGSNKTSEKLKKKLQEQKVSYWVASPSLPLRLYGSNGKQYMFLLHNEEERENWVSAIKKLIPKAICSVALTSFELQDLLSRQTINDLQKVEEMIVPPSDDDYLSGILRVRVISASDLKAKSIGLYCCLELDEYGKIERKARTLPANMDNATLVTTWDQDFELELVGSHTMKVQVCSKSLLKEETYAHGKVRLPIKELRQNKRHKLEINLTPQGIVTLVIEYFTNMASVSRKPTLLSSGVFGVPIEVVAKRERHDIPLIVQTCVDEVERRGLTEVGVYRVAGVLRDVQELRQSFDTDYLRAQMIAFETDIHAVAGLLKRYFRELPDPLFTGELYISFVHALGLSDPEARDQCLLSLLHSLPPVNFKTAVYLFKHLRNVAANSSENKMTHTNLATIFGPNLLRPGGTGTEMNAAAMDVVTPVSVVLYYLNCPEEYFDESPRMSPDSSAAGTFSDGGGGTGEKRRGTGGSGGNVVENFLRRENNSASSLSPKDKKADDELALSSGSGKVFRRSRRNASSKATSGSSLRGVPSSAKNLSDSALTGVVTARESII